MLGAEPHGALEPRRRPKGCSHIEPIKWEIPMFSTIDIIALVLATTMMLAPLAAVSLLAPPTPDAPLATTVPAEKR